MSVKDSRPLSRDKMKKAVQAFSELLSAFPDKSRSEVLQIIELKFDLSPLECDFLNKNFSDEKCSAGG